VFISLISSVISTSPDTLQKTVVVVYEVTVDYVLVNSIKNPAYSITKRLNNAIVKVVKAYRLNTSINLVPKVLQRIEIGAVPRQLKRRDLMPCKSSNCRTRSMRGSVIVDQK
jgi:hypothetical protein